MARKVGAADFEEEQQRQADVVDQSIGLLQEGRVDQADTLEQGAQGDDREDRQDDVESVDKQEHGRANIAQRQRRFNGSISGGWLAVGLCV